jgi:hypothetical protein
MFPRSKKLERGYNPFGIFKLSDFTYCHPDYVRSVLDTVGEDVGLMCILSIPILRNIFF